MLSSEKSIFENYDCGDPCQRKNAAVMVKTMHQNGLHYILPGLYKEARLIESKKKTEIPFVVVTTTSSDSFVYTVANK